MSDDQRDRSGAESLVQTFVDAGVRVCFTNPGTSEMHFVAALDSNPDMRCVLGLFEGVVTGAADGYARMTGTPAATLLHLGPGLGNGLANLHNAKKARTPLVNVVGDHATYHRKYDAPLTSDVEGIARPVSGPGGDELMRRIIAILLENEAGALSRVVGLFAQRNYNIETLTVAPTEDETLSRLTVTTRGDASKIEQIMKQLNKLIEVVKVMDLTDGDHVERELMLIKLRAEGTARSELKRTTDIFRGQIIDVTDTSYTVQLTGPSGKLDGFIRAIGKAVVLEVVRSGVSGISRGEKILSL